ncbi:uncharacterized protein LOC117649307 isoform X4 [Thrips palmi]|uniref:Uncharacterized protein LOC117649307 isoform X4 n=1 Tax=Thrips palmi TaxID=161013 RepID=A0A6P8ZRM9_THRPL|nr:uncharacterized protein LOC117649307 isoform X4 [Thrips palmi]
MIQRSPSGRYDIDVEHVECCPSEVLDRPFPCSVSRARKDLHTVLFSFNATSRDIFDDYKIAQVVYASWSSRGGWKQNAIVMKFPRACTSVRTYLPGLYKHFLEHATRAEGPFQGCPVPPGSYRYENVSSRGLVVANIPSLYYGRWRVDGRAYDREACIMCIRLTLRISPRKANTG